MTEVILRTVGGALAGALIGALFLFGFLDLIPGLEWVAESRWRAGGAGALIGASIGGISGLMVYWRAQAIKALAEDMGMTYIESAERELASRIRELFAARGSASFRNVMYREMSGVKLWIGDYILVKSGNKSNSRVVRTVALFEKDGFALPQFSLQREGMLLNMMSGIMGIEDIDFDDSPEFSDTYHLSGKPADAVRQLFSKRVRDFFAEETNWEVRGEGDQLVVLRPRRKMSASMLRKFITEATKIIALLDESAVGRSTMPPPVRREENETQARWKNLLVDDEQVAQFLKQPAPRSVPSAIKQRFLGHGIVFTYIAGPFLMMFGIFWTAAVFLAEGAPIFFPAIGIAIGIAGIALMIGGSRSRKSKLGLLTNGRVVNATISEVKDTDMLVNDETRWLVTATFYDGKGEFQATHAVYGATGDRLQEMMERGETVSCIYDPQKPSHFVLAVELVSNFNIRL